MEKPRYGFAIVCSIVLSLGLIAFLSCFVAEFKRTKEKNMKVDGKLCYLPRSPAFGFGIAALICIFMAQIVGNLVICKQFCSKEKVVGKQTIAITLLVLSWISFGFAVILLGASTSMNNRQPYGKGWLDGECYIVKDGVYIGSAILVMATISFVLGSVFATRTKHFKNKIEQGRKVHAQVG
ncbi:hypothetical protein HHK36_000557 [Tetracentron sinense]|uniref:Uncharacterized protein n=1 Tax=Tetracentron sinense TaxID=13715 RepID=A0A835DQ43_TETSI|nr:hypothetical protein HHK36_000557 [Tetracentron sinense]